MAADYGVVLPRPTNACPVVLGDPSDRTRTPFCGRVFTVAAGESGREDLLILLAVIMSKKAGWEILMGRGFPFTDLRFV